MKLGVIGAEGKMGKEIIALAANKQVFSITKKTRREEIPPLDIIIDFSTKKALAGNLFLALKHECPIVIGTTGLSQEENKLLEKAAKTIPVFWAANFSLGMAATAYATKILSSILQEFSSKIEETHHTEKKDAPSGSALTLKEAIEEGNPNKAPSVKSYRIGKVIGEHSASFLSDEEELTLTHKALSRSVFAKGALRASFFLAKKKPGLYTMNDLITTTLGVPAKAPNEELLTSHT